MFQLDIALSMKRLRNALGHRVSLTLSKIPYGGFSPVRLQTRSRRRPSSGKPRLIRRPRLVLDPLWPRRACCAGGRLPTYLVQRPLARPAVIVSASVNAYYGLIRATRGHPAAYFLRPSSIFGHEWVPNLSCVSVCACHPQHPGGSTRCN